MAHSIFARLFALAGVVALTSATLMAQAAVAGNWTIDIDSPQGVMKVGLVLTVNGDAVAGSISSDMGEAKFTGTTKDGTVTFSFDMAGPQGPMTITTKATVTGDDMKGEMDYGMGVAPFTGKRAER